MDRAMLERAKLEEAEVPTEENPENRGGRDGIVAAYPRY
jgi:hypothetical protein